MSIKKSTSNKKPALSRAEALYNILKDERVHKASTLAKHVGWRFGAAIFKLRAMGYYIESWQEKDGEWRYLFQARYSIRTSDFPSKKAA